MGVTLGLNFAHDTNFLTDIIMTNVMTMFPAQFHQIQISTFQPSLLNLLDLDDREISSCNTIKVDIITLLHLQCKILPTL